MYFGLFSLNEKRRIAQIFNMLNMFYLTYHMFYDSEATFAEDGFGFLSAMLNFYSLGDGRDFLTELSSWFMSGADSGLILTSVPQETMGMPLVFKLWQSLLLNPSYIFIGTQTMFEENELKNA